MERKLRLSLLIAACAVVCTGLRAHSVRTKSEQADAKRVNTKQDKNGREQDRSGQTKGISLVEGTVGGIGGMDKAISRLVKEWEKRQHFLKRLNEEGCTDEEECADTACETDEDQFDDGVYTFFDSWIICKPRRCEIGDWVRGADIMPDSGIARNYDTGEKLPEDVSPRTDSVHHGASSSGHKKQSEQILVPCSGNA